MGPGVTVSLDQGAQSRGVAEFDAAQIEYDRPLIQCLEELVAEFVGGEKIYLTGGRHYRETVTGGRGAYIEAPALTQVNTFSLGPDQS